MFKFCLSVLCLYVIINNIQRDFTSTYDVVSADPLPKDIQQNEHLSKYDSLQGDDDDDEVLIRVARSPDARPRGGRGGGSRGGSRSFRRSRGVKSGGTGGGSASFGLIFGVVLGSVFGSVAIFLIIYYCAKQILQVN